MYCNSIVDKQCGTCCQSKPLCEFSVKGSGYSSKCKVCQKAYWAEWYAKPDKKAQHIANSQKNSKKGKKELYELVAVAKCKPCTDCGKMYPHYVMDLDHLPGTEKVDSVARMCARGFSTAALLAEIAKCEVVCSNCHRERTFQRRKDSGVASELGSRLASGDSWV